MGFSQTDALLMAKISKIMYRNDNTFDNYFDEGSSIHNAWTRCVVGYVEEIDKIVIAFRGSSTLFGLVHSGFKSTCDEIWNAHEGSIRRLVTQYRGKKIIFTGHSRGGALAVLMAVHAKNADMPVGKIYTFGSPRVMSEFASLQRNIKHYRVENKQDPVSVLPWCYQYKHTGKLVLLCDSSCKAVVYSQGRNPLNRAVDLVDHKIMNAHNIDSYIDILEGNCGVAKSDSPPPDSDGTFSFAFIDELTHEDNYTEKLVVEEVRSSNSIFDFVDSIGQKLIERKAYRQ